MTNTGENLRDSFGAKVWNMLPVHISPSNKIKSFEGVA